MTVACYFYINGYSCAYFLAYSAPRIDICHKGCESCVHIYTVLLFSNKQLTNIFFKYVNIQKYL